MLDPAGSIDAGAEATLTAVRQAFVNWAVVTCSHLSFEERAWTEAQPGVRRNVIANDGDHRVFWAETEDAWPGDRGTLALTYTFYTLDDRRAITDADIVMNGVKLAVDRE